MIDYHADKRRHIIACQQIDIILDNREIPLKLLEDLGTQNWLKSLSL